MKTSAIEVHDMLSVFSVYEVEKRIGEVPGVESVTVNFAIGNATVRYDETRLDAVDIKSAVRQRSYEASAPAGATPGGGHEGHGAPATLSDDPKSAAPRGGPDAPAAEDSPDGAQPDKATPSATPDAPSAKPTAAHDGDAKSGKAAA